MDRTQLIAAMEALISTAEADGRDLTTDEATQFDSLKAKLEALDATAARRASLPALRQQAGIAERIERAALRPTQQLAAIYARPSGNTTRLGDVIKAQLGNSGMYASQNSNSGAAGGFTVPNFLSAEVLDLARAKSRVIQAGAPTLPINGPTNFATVESDPTIRNHAQNETINESEVVFGSRSFIPNTAVALVRASVELVEDSANFNAVVESVLAAAFAAEIDRRALYGSGVGEQLGLMNQADVTEINGATFTTWTPFSRAVQAVRAANYEPGAFVLSPGVLGAIDGLVEGGGSNQPLRRPPSLETAQFLDTTAIPASGTSAAVTGQFDNLFIAIRTGLTVEATRTGGDAFNKLSVLIRAYCRLDSFAVRPTAFARISGIPVPAVA
jgi:HK97 family phage major capsid protein